MVLCCIWTYLAKANLELFDPVFTALAALIVPAYKLVQTVSPDPVVGLLPDEKPA
jgi:hypothetical protein